MPLAPELPLIRIMLAYNGLRVSGYRSVSLVSMPEDAPVSQLQGIT